MSILNRKYGNFENYNLLSLDDSRRRDELAVKFYENRSKKSLITSENIIEVSDNSRKKIVYSPKFSQKFALDILIKETVKLEFKGDRIIINDIYEYDINNYSFYVKKYVGDILNLI